MGFGKGRNVMKQYIVAMQIVICTLFIFGGCGNDEKIEYPYTQEYEVGQGNIKGNVDIASFIAIDESFEIGANKDGYAVFKSPENAFEILLEKYDMGIRHKKKKFKWETVTQNNNKDDK